MAVTAAIHPALRVKRDGNASELNSGWVFHG